MGLGADQYLSQTQALLSPGAALTRDPGATLTQLFAALAEEFARVDARADALVEEADPRTAYELLPDWGRALGLPDECTAAEQTLQSRRAAVVARLTAIGGQSIIHFIDMAATLGHTVTIAEVRPSRAGVLQAGDELVGTESHVHYWQVTVPRVTTYAFVAGASTAGEELGYWQPSELECVFARTKPAHTNIFWNYI